MTRTYRATEEPMLPPASSLAILLLLFFGMGLLALASVMLGRSEGDGEGESASVAHGPAEFSALLEEDFTRGLDIAAREGEYRVPPPPFSEGIFPCSDCHTGAGEGDAKRRALEAAHTEIRLEHGGEDRWCLDCHDLRERDKLRLANGTLVPFEESYRLCGQCHGDKYRDWRSGIHGKRTGYWNGPKRYLLCAHCHNPHSPRFKPIRPLPPPVSPSHQARPAAGVAAETGGGS